MNVDIDRINRLVNYVKKLNEHQSGKELYQEYIDDIKNVKPIELFDIFYSLLNEGNKPKNIFIVLDKVLNVFHSSLVSYGWTRPENDNFLLDLQLENKAVLKKLDEIKEILEENSLDIKKNRLIPKIEELNKFNDHYLKKENILFPYLEKNMDKFSGVAIMWALHDEVRKQIKVFLELLKDRESTNEIINQEIGKLFFRIHGLVKKEELILFPVASQVLSYQDCYEMHKQSLDYNFPFINKEFSKLDNKDKVFLQRFNEDYQIKTETGILNIEQIMMIFNTLPVDISFVDENNKVKFFTRPKDRFFPRSPAIIDRDVKNCHPPDSVHIVQTIIDGFKSGKRDTAKFWINIKGKDILIQYFALRNNEGKYKGTLEVSQDITDIKSLEGERRLLDWDL